MSIQLPVETAIGRLVNEFLEEPYRFFTEADAVARFHQLAVEDAQVNRPARTRDGFEVDLVHREYPTFFRFEDSNPTARLGPPARRGHYDTVILNPCFVEAHTAEAVSNRTITTPRDETIVPFQAVIEFKLDNAGWDRASAAGGIAELGKLKLSAPEALLRYLVVLMRYQVGRLYRWNKYWPGVEQAAAAAPDIHSVVAVAWLKPSRAPQSLAYGRWLREPAYRGEAISGRGQD